MEATHCYIGRSPCCGVVWFARVDVPGEPKRVAKDVAKEMRKGSIIERVPINDIRSGAIPLSDCICPKPEKTAKNQERLL